MLEIGSKAPDFSLQGTDEKVYTLKDFLGKKIVLYFYPKDNTPGCSKQAQGFKEMYDEYLKKGYTIIGISKDSISSHKKFTEKYELPFLLLSDPDKLAINAYDVYKEKIMYGKKVLGVVRTTYVIDEKGVIISAQEKVNAADNAKELFCQLSK